MTNLAYQEPLRVEDFAALCEDTDLGLLKDDKLAHILVEGKGPRRISMIRSSVFNGSYNISYYNPDASKIGHVRVKGDICLLDADGELLSIGDLQDDQ